MRACDWAIAATLTFSGCAQYAEVKPRTASPGTAWTRSAFIRGDPLIRKHYQFWFYSYPSGYPYPYSAAILRDELDAVEKRFPSHKPMVVIGHSMGGCISRLLLTDSGDQLCLKIFGKPLDQVPLSPHTREYFQRALLFRHRREIGRVIFIAAPLRGSELASGWIGRFASHKTKVR